MRLWLLKPHKDWDEWYDKAEGFVVRAETEADARAVAASAAGDEGPKAWKDVGLTSCLELDQSGPPGVVLRDFAAA